MASVINTFTSGGKAMPFRQRPVFPNNGGDPAMIRSRVDAERGVKVSPSVRITNPAALRGRRGRRTASLGMGGVGTASTNV